MQGPTGGGASLHIHTHHTYTVHVHTGSHLHTLVHMLPCTHITDTQALTPIHSLSTPTRTPHLHTHIRSQTEHGGGCLELRQDLAPRCFQMYGGSRLCLHLTPPSSGQLETSRGRGISLRPSPHRPGREVPALAGQPWPPPESSPERPFFSLASPAAPWFSPGAQVEAAPLHSSVCKVRAVWHCLGGRDGARERGKLISQEKHASGRHSPAHCSLLEDGSLFITRTEGLGLWGPISPCVHCGQCCTPSAANHEPGRTLQLD